MEDHPGSILRVENLSYQYGGLEVWKDVEFRVESGEVVFLVGQNGTGKSTLLRCLAGLAYPKTGKIYLYDEPFSGKLRRQRSIVSFVSDTPSFYDDMTAEEHIRFVLQANHKGKEYASAETLFEQFTLSRYKGQYPSSFSRGMREKLALIIAFSVSPKLYLFDEPYNPLDRRASEVLSAEIKARVLAGSSVILSCHHSMPSLKPDKVLYLDDGKLSVENHLILDEVWHDGAGQMIDDDADDS